MFGISYILNSPRGQKFSKKIAHPVSCAFLKSRNFQDPSTLHCGVLEIFQITWWNIFNNNRFIRFNRK